MLTFNAVVEDFITAIDALRDFVDSVGPVLLQREEQASRDAAEVTAPFHVATLLASEDLEKIDIPAELKKILVSAREILIGTSSAVPAEKAVEFGDSLRKSIPIKLVGGKVEVDIGHEDAVRIVMHRRALDRLKNEVKHLRESSLMVLASRSEWFLAQLVHQFFKRFPDAAGTSEPFFSLNTLSTLHTIDEARDVLIEHKVEALMRLSFEDWMSFFKQKPKLGMGYLENEIPRIGEVFKRRNLAVHNGGKVSRRYLQEVDEPLRPGLKLGDTIDVTPEYLHSSIDLIEHQFVLIAAELWKKLDPADEERAGLLQNLCVQRIKEKRWTMARGFAYFVMGDKNMPEARRLASRVNYWQAFKWAGHYDQIRQEVEESDFSAKSPLFQIALFAIKDDFDSFFKLLPGVLENRHLEMYQLLDWPLFQAVRQRPEFEKYAPQCEREDQPAMPAKEDRSGTVSHNGDSAAAKIQ